MTQTRRKRLLPTGDCFCGCGQEAEIGRWFVLGHDITAAAALRAVEGRSLPQRLVDAGFGPERSVVEVAVERAGWVRCGGCAYAGTRAGLAAHSRAGSCTAEAAAAPDSTAAPAPGADQETGTDPDPGTGAGADPGSGEEPVAPADAGAVAAGFGRAGALPPVEAGAGAARGRLLPAPEDPSWEEVPLVLRQHLRGPAHQLVTPVQGR